MKKISVIIPNYNYEKYIIERIDSILNQTYPIYELIILDDCSTDKSVDLIENKIKTIDNIRDINLINFLCFLLSILNIFLSICFIGTFIINAIAIPTIIGIASFNTNFIKSKNRL